MRLADRESDLDVSPSYAQQMIRSCFYGISFGTAYLLMLLAMSYNGGVILSIFAGGAVGHFISAVSYSSSRSRLSLFPSVRRLEEFES